VRALRGFLPARAVLWEEEDTRPYECDGLTAYRQLPLIVVLPETTEQVSRVLRYCHEHGVKIVPRGAGYPVASAAPTRRRCPPPSAARHRHPGAPR
jgi:glycolate oxidase